MAERELDTATLIGRLQAIEAGRPGYERAQLHLALSEALASDGHTRITLDEPESSGGGLSGLLAIVTLWGLGASLGVALETPWFTWPLFAFGAALVVGVLANTPVGDGVALIAVAAWFAAGVVLVVVEPTHSLLTHGIPLAISFAVAIARRSLRLDDARDVALALTGFSRSAPFVVPIVLIFLFLPALNADVWELAAGLDEENLLAAGVMSVGLLLALVRLQLGREFESVLESRANALVSGGQPIEATRAVLTTELSGDSARLARELPDEPFREAWEGLNHQEYVPYVAAAEGRRLRSPLMGRLLVTTGLTGLLLASYTYGLLAVTVPRPVAGDWSGGRIPARSVDLIAFNLTLPLGEYITVAALFGTAATALFLAFTLTEERFAVAVTEALLKDPIERFLLLALPYSALTERVLDEAWDEPDPSASPGSGVPSDSSHSSRTS